MTSCKLDSGTTGNLYVSALFSDFMEIPSSSKISSDLMIFAESEASEASFSERSERSSQLFSYAHARKIQKSAIKYKNLHIPGKIF